MSVDEHIQEGVKPNTNDITQLPPLVIGGATFNYQYTDNPENVPIGEILDTAFSSGLIAIDTSPYYGPSEKLIGAALHKLEPKWPRESYFICTKAGRLALNDFDFSRKQIRFSVERSLQRLHTSYLDLVYLHDIEFGKEDDILEGLKELKKLKSEGIVRNFGITGYPVDFLYKMAALALQDPDIGSLDAILSYSNGCIQNTILFDYYEKFLSLGIKKIMNGSILSMSLLRSDKTHDFHPAPQELKLAVDDVAQHFLKEDIELAELATRYAFRNWLFDTKKAQKDKYNMEWNLNTSVVLGLGNVEELKLAITNFWKVKLNIDDINEKDSKRFQVCKELLGEHFNETWDSGIEH